MPARGTIAAVAVPVGVGQKVGRRTLRSNVESQPMQIHLGSGLPPRPGRGNISCMLPPLRRLEPQEWQLLRLARLTALKESPDAFLATHACEMSYDQERWQEEFDRGEWFVREHGEGVICMTGVTREYGAPSDVRYLEYVWVAPEYRRDRVAYDMLSEVLRYLKESGVRTVFLYVLEGNQPATWLYKRLDFQSTDKKPLLPDGSGRREEQFSRDLTER